MRTKKYWIKSDYGYGDWSTPYFDMTEEDAIIQFNDCITYGRDILYTTIEECLDADVINYSLHEGEAEFNQNWMDS